jgi:hypothetical protein
MSEESLREPETGLNFEKVWQMFQERDRRMKETDRKISKLGSRIGDLVEELIFPNIMEKFRHRCAGSPKAHRKTAALCR